MTEPVLGRPNATPGDQIDTFRVEGPLDLVHFHSSELTASCPVTDQPDFILDRDRVRARHHVHRDQVAEALPANLRWSWNLRRAPGPPHRRTSGRSGGGTRDSAPHPAGTRRYHHVGDDHRPTHGLSRRRSARSVPGGSGRAGPCSLLLFSVLSVTGRATVGCPAGGHGSLRVRNDATTDRRGS